MPSTKHKTLGPLCGKNNDLNVPTHAVCSLSVRTKMSKTTKKALVFFLVNPSFREANMEKRLVFSSHFLLQLSYLHGKSGHFLFCRI